MNGFETAALGVLDALGGARFFIGVVFFAFGVRGLRVTRAARSASTTQPADLVVPDTTDGRSSELASREVFMDRLLAISHHHGYGQQCAPLLFVRLEGVDRVRHRYGTDTADRIMLALAHRLRANLRRDDTVVRFLPAEVFVLLSGEVLEDDAMVVVRRLRAAMAMPIPEVKSRQLKHLKVDVQLVQARFTNGRVQIVVDNECLVDTPIAPRLRQVASAELPPARPARRSGGARPR